MERRWFTNGARVDFAASPADVVKFRHDGWQECAAPSAKAPRKQKQTEADDKSTADDNEPEGTTA